MTVLGIANSRMKDFYSVDMYLMEAIVVVVTSIFPLTVIDCKMLIAPLF